MNRRSEFLERTYTDVRYRFLLHLIFWAFLFGSYYYFNTISFNPTRDTPAAWLLAVKNVIVVALAFYALMYFIWPRFFFRKRWFAGTVFFLLCLCCMAALDAWGDRLIFGTCDICYQRLAQFSPDYYQFLQRNFPSIVFVRVVTGGFLYHLVIQLSFPVAIKLGRGFFRQTVQRLQLEKNNLQLEFNFLKAQVNPHFLFNTLNNIYSLVVAERNGQAAATLSQLSGFMRYALYETGDEKIALEKEVQLLKDYVELEKLRLNETGVGFRFESDNAAYTIPPLLLMPALENAFKYTPDKKESRINVLIRADKGMLNVRIENNFEAQQTGSGGGIGLHNLQRRVQHYYGNKAVYSATAANGVYLFSLSFPLT